MKKQRSGYVEFPWLEYNSMLSYEWNRSATLDYNEIITIFHSKQSNLCLLLWQYRPTFVGLYYHSVSQLSSATLFIICVVKTS